MTSAPSLAGMIDTQLAELQAVRQRREEAATALAALEEQVLHLEADLRAVGSFYVCREEVPEADRERARALLAKGGIVV